jgi:hypothetical protein
MASTCIATVRPSCTAGGTDESQSDDPRMNFRDSRYDGMRGRINDHGYREYLPAADAKLAPRMADAIRRVRGREYKVKPAVGLYPRPLGMPDRDTQRCPLGR